MFGVLLAGLATYSGAPSKSGTSNFRINTRARRPRLAPHHNMFADNAQPHVLKGDLLDLDFTMDMDHRKRRRNRTTQSCLNCHTSKRKVRVTRPQAPHMSSSPPTLFFSAIERGPFATHSPQPRACPDSPYRPKDHVNVAFSSAWYVTNYALVFPFVLKHLPPHRRQVSASTKSMIPPSGPSHSSVPPLIRTHASHLLFQRRP